jgi:hypothetical protein
MNKSSKVIQKTNNKHNQHRFLFTANLGAQTQTQFRDEQEKSFDSSIASKVLPIPDHRQQ